VVYCFFILVSCCYGVMVMIMAQHIHVQKSPACSVSSRPPCRSAIKLTGIRPLSTSLQSSSSSSSNAIDWSYDLVPRSYNAVEADMTNAVYELLSSSEYNDKQTYKLYSIDLLTPGLNPKLEQKAMLLQEYLFSLVVALFPVLSR
jgi:hypothetical protein